MDWSFGALGVAVLLAAMGLIMDRNRRKATANAQLEDVDNNGD